MLLEIQVHQQELTQIITPQPNLHPVDLEFQEHLQEFETLFSKLKEFSLLESQYHLWVLLQKHNHDISEYIQKLRDLNQQISQFGSQPEALAKSQQLS